MAGRAPVSREKRLPWEAGWLFRLRDRKKWHGLSYVVFCIHHHGNKPSDFQTHWSSISCPDGAYPTGLECAECLLMFWDVSIHFRSMSAGLDFCTKPQAQWTRVITIKGLVTEFEQQRQKGSPGVWFQLLWLTGSPIFDRRLPHHPWGRGWSGGWHPVGPLPLCPVEGMEEVQDHTTLHAQSQSCAHPDKGPLFLTHTSALTRGLVVAWKDPGGLKAHGMHFPWSLRCSVKCIWKALSPKVELSHREPR